MSNEDRVQYAPPEDIKIIRGVYPVQSKMFSLALIKVRYEKMDRASQIRAERTMLAMSDGRNWDAKSGS
jgi:hypothetical protein